MASFQQPRAQSPPPPYATDRKHPDTPQADTPPLPPQKIPVHEPLLANSPSPYPQLAKRDYDSISSPSTSNASARATSQAPRLPPMSLRGGMSSPAMTETDSIATATTLDDRSRGRETSVSMDDPNDRMAAEALCGLGKAEPLRSPTGYETPLQYFPIDIAHTHKTKPASSSDSDQPEPLLSLLTSSHPWLGGTINGSLNAYSSTKNNSPRFIRYSADFVERNIGSPMANTVGSVGRKVGVEGSLRRYLGSRRTSEMDRMDHIDPALTGESSNKRRRISDEDSERMDTERGPGSDIRTAPVASADIMRTLSGSSSVDTLPMYDENRSPPYEDHPHSIRKSTAGFNPASHSNRSWSTQLMISTSGLGAALNEASLRSLKLCLSILRNANTHVRQLMEALRNAMQEFDRSHGSSTMESGLAEKDHSSVDAMSVDGRSPSTGAHDKKGTVQERIAALNAEIWNTLKNVVTTVSRYTGGALPDNASVVVRWQLMSVPQRWRRAITRSSNTSNSASSDNSASSGGEGDDAVNSAHRMMAFAIEGLDMMDQVGGVVDSTIMSAERWLETMGRKQRSEDVTGETKDTDTTAEQEIPVDGDKDLEADKGSMDTSA